MKPYLLGFDVGGTKCAVVLGRLDSASPMPQILGRRAFPTAETLSPDATLDRLADEAGGLLREYSVALEEVDGLGISCGGPLDRRCGLVLGPPNLPGWEHVPIVQILKEKLGIRAYLENDANACALAEWRWGAGRGADTAVFLTMGTGLGAGLIINGRLHSGRDDLAGEAGHLRLAEDGPVGYGKAGSFEGWCSGGGIERRAHARIRQAWERGETVSFCPGEEDLSRVNARTLADAARAGEVLAQAVFAEAGFYLGRGMAILLDLLNPDVIVLGSVYARCEDLLRPAALRVLQAEALPAAVRRCRIAAVGLGEQVGDYAALAAALPVEDGSFAEGSPR